MSGGLLIYACAQLDQQPTSPPDGLELIRGWAPNSIGGQRRRTLHGVQQKLIAREISKIPLVGPVIRKFKSSSACVAEDYLQMPEMECCC